MGGRGKEEREREKREKREERERERGGGIESKGETSHVSNSPQNCIHIR